MSDETWLILIRVAIIVFPAGVSCFILGFLWGRSTAYKEMKSDKPLPAIDEPDFVEEKQTVVTKRNRKVMI
jgi:hypothetical protein